MGHKISITKVGPPPLATEAFCSSVDFVSNCVLCAASFQLLKRTETIETEVVLNKKEFIFSKIVCCIFYIKKGDRIVVTAPNHDHSLSPETRLIDQPDPNTKLAMLPD
jgi:hypothetical protein